MEYTHGTLIRVLINNNNHSDVLYVFESMLHVQ